MVQLSYRLADHVCACSIDRQVILLDLRRDKYIGFRASDAAIIAPHVRGWPTSSTLTAGMPDAKAAHESRNLLDELMQAGLISRDDIPRDEAISSISLDRPSATLIDGYVDVKSAISGRDVLRFLISSFAARMSMTSGLFYSTVRRIRQRRAAQNSVTAVQRGTLNDNLEETRRLVSIYLRLRIFLFTAANECLFDSLALLTFLARYGILPLMIIGVKTRPFAAHCWLQQGSVVLNDTPDHVLKYSPILVA
jgi:hypothetical protein